MESIIYCILHTSIEVRWHNYIMKKLGIEMPDIESDEAVITTGNNTAGDLAEILNLNKYLTYADHEYTVEGYNTHNVENMEWNFQTVLYIMLKVLAQEKFMYIGILLARTCQDISDCNSQIHI